MCNNECGDNNPTSSTTATSSVLTIQCNKSKCKCAQSKKTQKFQLCHIPQNIECKFNLAKCILKERSAYTGENLYEHLKTLIWKFIDQQPTNIADYFEEYSRNIRDKKNCPDCLLEFCSDDARILRVAENILQSLKLNACDKPEDIGEEDMGEWNCNLEDFHILLRPINPAENILQLQTLWTLCGFGFQFDEVYQLSCAMMKIIQLPIVMNCRFWGKVYSIQKSYYVVEVDLTSTEKTRRYEKMRLDMQQQICEYQQQQENENYLETDIDGRELLPGRKWKNYKYSNIKKMKPIAKPIPQPIIEDSFDTPPEPIGSGLNRRCYYVITSLTDEWTELPIVTPKQINSTKTINKYFTGNLEADINSYPIFPGKEKHYLRAIIARITSSTYIAPIGFYRKRTKKDDIGREADEEEEEEEDEDEEDELDDTMMQQKLLKDRNTDIIANEKFIPRPIEDMEHISEWVHITPSVLEQGRIMYFDVDKALKKRCGEGEVEEEDEEEDDDGEEGGNKEIPYEAIGKPLFAPIELDKSTDITDIWTTRLTSKLNKMNRMIMIRSNLWPGSYSFAYEKFCDTIYIGWGNKYVPRNYMLTHIPETQNEYEIGPEIEEMTDPTPQLEEEWKLAHLLPPIKYEAEDDEEEDEEEEEEE